MPAYPVVAAATGGAAAFFAVTAYRTWLRAGEGALRTRLGPASPSRTAQAPGLIGAAAARAPAWLHGLAGRICSAMPAPYLERLRRLAGAAGFEPTPTPGDVLAAGLVLAGIGATAGAAAGAAAGMAAAGVAAAGVAAAGVAAAGASTQPGSALAALIWCGTLLGAAAGAAWPARCLLAARARRRGEVARELPETLDLLVICADAGLGLPQAVRTVAMVVPGVVGQELRRAVREMDAGLAAARAMRAMSGRCDLHALSALAAALAQGERLGAPVAETLRRQAVAARAARRQELEKRIDTLPTRLTLVAIFMLLPPLFVVAVLPSVLSFTAAWR